MYNKKRNILNLQYAEEDERKPETEHGHAKVYNNMTLNSFSFSIDIPWMII